MMKTTEFTESGGIFTDATRVAGNTIHNVSLLGAKSSNGRVYTRQALKDAAKLYSGLQIFADHPASQDLTGTGGRRFEDLAGKVVNARVVGDRVRGDIHLLSGEPIGEKLLTIAEEAPGLAGFSHRASGEATIAEDGTQVVERITEVHALEIVVDPATTHGLFESKEKRMGKKKGKGEGESPKDVTSEVVEAAATRLFGQPFGEGLSGSKLGSETVTDEVVQEAARKLFI